MACEGCITNSAYCPQCRDNPMYASILRLRSMKKLYQPVCPVGKTDCVNDPAYILFSDPEWYKGVYGSKTPQEAVQECHDRLVKDDRLGWVCNYYDDEDK